MSKLLFVLSLLCISFSGFAQTSIVPDSSIFARIAKELKDFKADTSKMPEDSGTMAVQELRALRGGFNINEVISFKISEDSVKGDLSPKEAKELGQYFRSGQGKAWLDNAITRIYQSHFTEEEIQELVRFYQTPAGQKLANEYPIIMMQSIAAGQMVKDAFPQKKKVDK